MQMISKVSKQRGFTLLEVLVVVACVIVLVGLVVALH
jgi:prepilin-type N-terminal cleavage/methylation domain-containing protein